ncbi:DNA polymerase I [Thermotomaculum hydrothermale]|uniref:DNA polymerase I n=1 Tax=Thermotomaculum hydrothermale TaxID=981385 RepID=A0A7R6PUR2_9BACT|nr:DNA polymerase I [Thermotomaculum hydrothermale]BBB33057.1 DNA polymerase I [Thermotomaculum hydrothermale]
MEKSFYIIDAYAHIFRSYYAIRNIDNNAIYGFTRILIKLFKDYNPEYAVCVFDTGKPTFRHEMFEDYKATRKKMPEDLAMQIPKIKEIVDAFNIERLEIEGLEADDLIATLSYKASQEGFKVYIVSSDKDLFQLVNDNVFILDPKKDYKIYDSKGIEEFFGVSPDQVADVLALMGDASDNIPGAKGIGEKTAKKLIKEFGSLDRLYNNLYLVKGKTKEKLEKSRENVFLSKKLVELDIHRNLNIDIESFRVKQPDFEKLYSIFRELKFNSLIKELELEGKTAHKEEEKEYVLIDTIEKLKEFIKILQKQKFVAFDTETCNLDIVSPKLAGISFSFEKNKGYYIPLISENKEILPTQTVISLLKPVLENEKIKKCGHNLKYDYQVLKGHGIEVKGIEDDSMILSYLLNSNLRQHNLDDAARDYLDYTTIKYKELTEDKKLSFCDLPAEKVYKYSSEDSDVALQLTNLLKNKVKELNMEDLYKNIEMPLVKILAEMELNGVLVDRDFLEKLSKEFEEKLKKLEMEIFEEAGCQFNINSPKQLGEVLFEKLQLPVLKKTKKTKSYSTSHEILEQLANDFKIARLIVDYRKFGKLKSTYVDALPKLIHPKTGRIHTSYNQTVTATGRLSSSNPNLQNIPARTEEGKRIREAFIAPEGYKLISADYSQIELRVLAHLSGDKTLIEAFKKGADIHSETASQLFGVSADKVTSELRAKAKAINFGIIYGKKEYSLSQELGITPKEAKDFIQSYFEKMPSVKEFIENTIENAKKEGFVKTMFGRIRYVPEFKSNNFNIRQHGERIAINTVIQGTAADIIKIAMINLDKRLRDLKESAKLIMQVHDELIFEVKEENIEKISKIVKEEMENAADLTVPLTVNISIGNNWAEAK